MRNITIEQLHGEQKEIAEIIGLEAYQKLSRHYSGCSIYIGKCERIDRCQRNAEIRQKFNGNNYKQLAAEYGLSEFTIRKIVKK